MRLYFGSQVRYILLSFDALNENKLQLKMFTTLDELLMLSMCMLKHTPTTGNNSTPSTKRETTLAVAASQTSIKMYYFVSTARPSVLLLLLYVWCVLQLVCVNKSQRRKHAKAADSRRTNFLQYFYVFFMFHSNLNLIVYPVTIILLHQHTTTRTHTHTNIHKRMFCK